MTPHGKTNHGTHTQPPLVLACLSYPDGGFGNLQLKSACIRQSAEKLSRDETGFARIGRVWRFGSDIEDRLTERRSPQQRRDQRDRDQHRHADQRPASDAVDAFHEKFSVSVRFVALRGGAFCPSSNRAHCRRCGLGEHFEQMFEETRRPNVCQNSAASASRSGLTRRPTLSWHSASAALSAPHSSTSPAIGSRLTKRSWQSSTNYGPASGPETCGGVESRHAECPLTPDAKIVVGSPERRSQSGAGVAPGPQDQSRAKEPKANAGSAVTTSDRPAMGSSRPVTGRSVTATSELMDATAGETALNSSFDCAAPMRVMFCGVRIPLDPEGKPEANGTRPRRRNPSKYGRDSRRDGTELCQCHSFSDIGSARGTSAMLQPGAVDGTTANLAGQASGDRAERRSTNSNCKPEQLETVGDRMRELASQHVTAAAVAAPNDRYRRAA